jgi:hypothetical protein
VVDPDRQFAPRNSGRIVEHAKHTPAQDLRDQPRLLLDRSPLVLAPDTVDQVRQERSPIVLLLGAIAPPGLHHGRDERIVAVLDLPKQHAAMQDARHVERVEL